jgi:hypothetical protein
VARGAHGAGGHGDAWGAGAAASALVASVQHRLAVRGANADMSNSPIPWSVMQLCMAAL